MHRYPMLQWISILTLALCFSGWGRPAMAADFILERAWLEDVTGTLAFDEIKQRATEFQSYDGILTRGFTSSAFWVRLKIAPATEPHLVLRIRPTFIDQIVLYDPLGSSTGTPMPQLSGDRHPEFANGYLSLNHGFLLLGRDRAREIYLRVTSTSTLLIHFEAITIAEADYADHRQEIFYSIYLGFLVAFVLWAFLHWLTSRSLLLTTFLIKQAIVLLYAMTIQGYLPVVFGQLMPPPALDRLTSLAMLGYVFGSALFMLVFLSEFKPVRWLWLTFAGLLLAYVPIVGLFAFDHIRQALHLNMLMAAIQSLAFFLIAITARAWKTPAPQDSPPIARWVLISFSLAVFVTAYSAVLPGLGPIDATEWNLYAPLIPAFIHSLLMIVLLTLITRNRERHRQQMAQDLLLSQYEVQQERIRREEQQQFLAMLTHELKTPLSVARLSLGTARIANPQRDRIDRALMNINAIIDRCRVTDQLEHQQLVPRTDDCDLFTLIHECITTCDGAERVKVSESFGVRVRSDSQLLGICIANLIENAVKYSPPDSIVNVDVCPQTNPDDTGATGFVIAVRNAVGSAGLPDPAQLFAKYYRSPGAHRKSGSGLGLYLTRGIAARLGLQLNYSADGGDVKFILWIPV